MARNSMFFFCDFESYDEKAAKKHLTPESVPLLQALSVALGNAAPWNATTVQAAINGVADQTGLSLGKVAQPLRVAVTGGAVSPPIDVTVALLGVERTQARIARAERRALE
jgi:glutamyl-tRNA synthetase